VLLQVSNKYTATTAVVPEAPSRLLGGASQLAGLAAFAGVNINLDDAGATRSPRFYVAVLRSRPVQYAVLNRRVPTNGAPNASVDADSLRLVELLAAEGSTLDERLWHAAKKLDKAATISSDPRTNIIYISVTRESPVLAAAIANAYGQELIRFNQEVRQSRARATRRFVETRVEAAAADLAEAEDAVRHFLAANREYQNSPRLVFEYASLDRALGVQQELYLELRRQLDAARIAEVDDIPALTTIQPALVPEEKSGPKRTIWCLVVISVTALLASTVFIAMDHDPSITAGLSGGLRALSPSFTRRTRHLLRK
jgi:uncharacterized protein involved in exopolysaccharide biosynthesis